MVPNGYYPRGSDSEFTIDYGSSWQAPSGSPQNERKTSLSIKRVEDGKGKLFGRHPESLTLTRIFFLLRGTLARRREVKDTHDLEHKVVQGDSLFQLAKKYGTTVPFLKKLNSLHNDRIYVGSVLKIGGAEALLRHETSFGRKLSVKERNAMVDNMNISTHRQETFEDESFFMFSPLLQRYGTTKQVPKLKTVRVQAGDTLACISYLHRLSIQELKQLNNLRNDVIYEGDVLAVSTGLVDRGFPDLRPGRRRTGRLLFSRENKSDEKSNNNPKPKPQEAKTQGIWEQKRNGPKHLKKKMPQFHDPLLKSSMSSPFGWRWGAFHEGIDLAAEQGAPILASDRGIVTFAGWNGGYGYLVSIHHEGGFTTRYAHCCAIYARVGQQVMKGQQIAAVGSSGHATGPHLHFEVRQNGKALDPLKWVALHDCDQIK